VDPLAAVAALALEALGPALVGQRLIRAMSAERRAERRPRWVVRLVAAAAPDRVALAVPRAGQRGIPAMWAERRAGRRPRQEVHRAAQRAERVLRREVRPAVQRVAERVLRREVRRALRQAERKPRQEARQVAAAAPDRVALAAAPAGRPRIPATPAVQPAERKPPREDPARRVARTAQHTSVAALGSSKSRVKAGADYCGGWRGSRTLEQELAAKAKLHVTAGNYALPDGNGTYSFALPVCFEFPSGAVAPSFAGPGQITLKQSTHAPEVYYRDDFKQPLVSSTASSWSFLGYLSFTSTVGVQPAPWVLDGTGLFANNTFQQLDLCTSDDCLDSVNDIWFDSCNPETYSLNRSTVTFDGGQVILEVRIATLPGGISESPVFVLASGTLDLVTFEQRDYWKLVYAASHHQFSRSFAVLFDSPINGACGIKVTALDPYNGTQLPQVNTIHCDLSNIAERSVRAAVTERP
jgi:hypothetical protein